MKQSSEEGRLAVAVALMKFQERLSSVSELFIAWIVGIILELLPRRYQYAFMCTVTYNRYLYNCKMLDILCSMR